MGTPTGRMALGVGGVVVAGGLGGSIYLNFRKQKRDEITQAFITELRKEFNPGSQGLAGLDALGENYLSKIRKGLSSSVTILVMRNEEAVKYAQRIHEAWGTLSSDEEIVYEVLRELKDKVQISQVATSYRETYGKALSAEFTSELNDDKIQTVIDLIKSKPAYRSAAPTRN